MPIEETLKTRALLVEEELFDELGLKIGRQVWAILIVLEMDVTQTSAKPAIFLGDESFEATSGVFMAWLRDCTQLR